MRVYLIVCVNACVFYLLEFTETSDVGQSSKDRLETDDLVESETKACMEQWMECMRMTVATADLALAALVERMVGVVKMEVGLRGPDHVS